MKDEIMRRKSRLRGERIYIEHDLFWSERRKQERILRWAIEEGEKGRVCRGLSKVMIKGKWIE